MAPPLAASVRRQLPEALESIKSLGQLQSVSFEGVAAGGSDVYLVTFEHGKVRWTIGSIDGGRQGAKVRFSIAVAKVSHHTVAALRGKRPIDGTTLLNVARVIETVRQTALAHADDQTSAMQLLQDKRAELGSDAALAEFLRVSRPHASKLLSGSAR